MASHIRRGFPMSDKEEEDKLKGTLFASPVYFRGDRFLFKILRLFNLMEPDRTVISISKTMVWSLLAVLVYTLLYHYSNLTAIIGAIASLLPVLANYAFRRAMAGRSDTGHVVPVDEKESE